jgi:hypothetical protein
VFLLFAQPDGFAIPLSLAVINPPVLPSDRLDFNIKAFVEDAGLGQALAVNYIVVGPPGSAPYVTGNASSSSTVAVSPPVGTGGPAAPANASAPVASGLAPQPPATAKKGGAGRVGVWEAWWGVVVGLLAALAV